MPENLTIDSTRVNIDHSQLQGAGDWEETRRVVELKAAEVQSYAREYVPVGVTGRLAATIRKGPTGTEGRDYYVEILAGQEGTTPYLGYVLFGTGAHEIRAIENRPNAHLRFASGGVIYFRKRVWHPGNAPNNFLERALVSATEGG